jgi:sorbitol-specific phosphotransferase system component IIC
VTDDPVDYQRLNFSQRCGLEAVPTMLSFRDIPNTLQEDLFNTLQVSCHKCTSQPELASDVWMHFFHEPITDIPRVISFGAYNISISQLLTNKRLEFIIRQKKYHIVSDPSIYDLVEFVYASPYADSIRELLQESTNLDFKRNFASVKMIDGLITPISDEEQARAIETAMQGPLDDVNSQVRAALSLLANREKPNYRDSVKNSISAVESLCKHIVGDSKATLGGALKELKNAGVTIHPALEKALGELYGYASDIARHGLIGSDNLDVEDARHMLVTCSAFINYLVVKADKAGIKLWQEPG